MRSILKIIKNRSLIVCSILLLIFLLTSCNPATDDNTPDYSNYITFTQTLSGLLTGTTDFEGTLKLNTMNDNIQIKNGTFTVLPELFFKKPQQKVKVEITTDNGITKYIQDAIMKEDGIYFPLSNKKVSHLLEKDECLKKIVSQKDPETYTEFDKMILNWDENVWNEIYPWKLKLLTQLQAKLAVCTDASQQNEINSQLQQLNRSIDEIRTGSYNLMTLFNVFYGYYSGVVWEKKPTILIYNRSLWSKENGKWIRDNSWVSWVDESCFIKETNVIKDFFSKIAPSIYKGIWSGAFKIRIESSDPQMPSLQEACVEDKNYVIVFNTDWNNFCKYGFGYYYTKEFSSIISKAYFCFPDSWLEYHFSPNSNVSQTRIREIYYSNCFSSLLGARTGEFRYVSTPKWAFNKDFTKSSSMANALAKIVNDGDPGLYFKGDSKVGYKEMYGVDW